MCIWYKYFTSFGGINLQMLTIECFSLANHYSLVKYLRAKVRAYTSEAPCSWSACLLAQFHAHTSSALFVQQLFLVQLVSSCSRLFKLILFCFFIEKSEA